MNSLAKPISIGATLLYVIGVFYTAWYLIALPDHLREASDAINLQVTAQIRPIHFQVLIIVGATLGLGVLALICQFISSNNSEANIVYVEKRKDTEKQTAKLQEEDEESHDVSAMNDELLEAIRQAAASGEGPDKKLELALRAVCAQLQASQGAVYVSLQQQNQRMLELRAGYALMKPDSALIRYEWGEGLPGQVAKEGQLVNISKVPEGYIKVLSGLGSASPKHLLLVPVRINDTVAAVVEIASFTPIRKSQEELVKQSFEIMAKIIEESSRQEISAGSEEDSLLHEPIKR